MRPETNGFVPAMHRSSSVAPGEMAQQSALLKEDHLRREEEKLKEIEMRVQREILQRKQELSGSLSRDSIGTTVGPSEADTADVGMILL
jgi:hypothetical protein